MIKKRFLVLVLVIFFCVMVSDALVSFPTGSQWQIQRDRDGATAVPDQIIEIESSSSNGFGAHYVGIDNPSKFEGEFLTRETTAMSINQYDSRSGYVAYHIGLIVGSNGNRYEGRWCDNAGNKGDFRLFRTTDIEPESKANPVGPDDKIGTGAGTGTIDTGTIDTGTTDTGTTDTGTTGKDKVLDETDSKKCTPSFAVKLEFIGGTPPGCPKQWPIYIDGELVGQTNDDGYLQTTSSVGFHKFSTSNTWTYKGNVYKYSGLDKREITCKTMLFPLVVNRA